MGAEMELSVTLCSRRLLLSKIAIAEQTSILCRRFIGKSVAQHSVKAPLPMTIKFPGSKLYDGHHKNGSCLKFVQVSDNLYILSLSAT
jgi:hypothetical protein